MSNDSEIRRQMEQIRDERMMLRDELEQMQPKSWKQDAGMNEVPIYSAAQLKRRAVIGRKLAQLAEADRALERL